MDNFPLIPLLNLVEYYFEDCGFDELNEPPEFMMEILNFIEDHSDYHWNIEERQWQKLV